MTSREIERRLTQQDNDIAALYELVTEVQQDVRALATRTDERFDRIEATLQLILERLPPSA